VPTPLVRPVAVADRVREAVGEARGAADLRLPVAALAALILRYTGQRDLVLGVVDVVGERPRTARIYLDSTTPADVLLGSAAGALRAGAAGTTERAHVHGVVAVGGPAAAQHKELLRYADIALVLEPHARQRLVLVGNGTLYDPSTVDRLARHIGTLLEALAGNDGLREVGTLPLLDGPERHEILVAWNNTSRQVRPDPVPQLIAEIARATPDSPAVVQEGVTTTFGELDGGANRMANHLVALGAAPGANVGVFMERRAESLLAQLAIFKTGAAAVLLDPEYPTERLAFMLSDSSAVAVLTTRRLADVLASSGTDGPPVVVIDDGGAAWRVEPDRDPAGRIDDRSVSHVAYTSGSTGTPKAVLLRHGPFRNTVHVLRTACRIDNRARGTWLCSPGFGLVEVDCFPILAAGGVVHIPPIPVTASPEALRDWLVDNQITHTLQLTAMAERLWTLQWPAACALGSMRIAGERVRQWPPADLPFTVLNVYGSAEANVVATADLTATAAELSDAERSTRMVPIGRPVANVRTYVLDGNLQPVPPGVLGELCISGESLSRGYLNRPEAESARFVPNPLIEDPYPVLYRSGDVARQWPNGVIEVVGRTDDETKIRGYRVHLGEIESLLAAEPGVRQCAVIAHEDAPGDRRLVAYVEPDPAGGPLLLELRGRLARRLPPYMLPAAYVIGDLPTTANGKIHRAALSPPPRTRPELSTPYQQPRTPLERTVAALVADVMGIDGVGLLDDFFELGGDSLRAVRLIDGIRQRLGLELGMADLFDLRTIGGIVQVVGNDDRFPARGAT
jgi:amino acid adenylation domain-containing protein